MTTTIGATTPTSLPDTRWRTRDIVVAAVIGVAFGVVFWVWGLVWYGPFVALDAVFPPLRDLFYAVWLVPAVLAPLVIRKPVQVSAEGATLAALPGPMDRLEVIYDFEAPPPVGRQTVSFRLGDDDFIETLLLNLFFAGALKAMPAKLVSDDGEHVVIRPLVYVGEDEERAYTKECELPVIGCCCPACGDLGLQRQRTKRMLMELEREHPGVKQSMLKALSNVAPRHLLDTRLNPPGELRRRHAVPA